MSDRELVTSYLLTVYMPIVGHGTRAIDYTYTYTDTGAMRLVCLVNGDVVYTTQQALDKWLERFCEYRTEPPLEWTEEDERGRGVIK